MDRRKFLFRVMTGIAGTTAGMTLTKGGLCPNAKEEQENRSIVYDVNGFTCVTCATGLETMLLQQKGVTRASASYPAAKVAIGFDQNLISERALREFIVSCGFSAT